MNTERITKLVAITSTSLFGVVIFSQIAFAQDTEQTVPGTYMALALAVISLMSNVFNFYMAEKAKRVGLNPNSTDERIINKTMELFEKFQNSEQKISNLTEFVYSIAPEEAQKIVGKPAIQIRNVTKDVQEADEKVSKFRDLLDDVQEKVNK